MMSSQTSADSTQIVASDLSPEWLTYNGQVFTPYINSKAADQSICLAITPQQYAKKTLLISNTTPIDISLNGNLIARQVKHLRIDVDSLTGSFPGSRWLIAVFGARNSRMLRTEIVAYGRLPALAASNGFLLHKPDFFRDFVVIATLVIMILLAAARSVNPKLLTDYFSVRQLILNRDTDDTMHHGRVTRSSNLIFYVMCGLMLGLFMQMVLRFMPTPLPGFWNKQPDSFAQAFLQWISLTLLILGALCVKWVIVFLASQLFGFREIVRSYLFNWVRILLLMIAPFLAIIAGAYLLTGGIEGLYRFLFVGLFWVLSIWIIIILYKLRVRVGFSLFHIICYLCITELIPLLILSKFLYA